MVCLIVSGFSFMSRVKQSTVFKITETRPYCGGANRTHEPGENDLKKRIPVGESFYIIKGKVNTAGRKIIKSFSINAAGSGYVTLSPGTYSVINKFLLENLVSNASPYDETCMKKLWAAPLFSFTVVRGICDTIIHSIAIPCEYNKPCSKLNHDIPM